jgi:hypothetical protein
VLRAEGLQMRKSSTKTHVRLANGQRVASTKVCDLLFIVAQHESISKFHVLRDLRDAGIVLGLPWLDDDQAALTFGNERHFILIHGIVIENQVMERQPECLRSHDVDEGPKVDAEVSSSQGPDNGC